MSLFSLAELPRPEEGLPEGVHLGFPADAGLWPRSKGLGIEIPPNPLFDWYHGLIDFEFWLRKYGGEDVITWVKAHVHPLDIVFRLAEHHCIVLLNGGRLRGAELVGPRLVRQSRRRRLRRHRPRSARRRTQLRHGVPGLTAGGRIRREVGGRDESMAARRASNHPEVTFFLVLGLGYVVGKVKLEGFTLGAVTGTLVAGVVVGQLGVQVSGEVKQCFFLLFLFAIGFEDRTAVLSRSEERRASTGGAVGDRGHNGPRGGLRRQSNLQL